MVFFKSIVRKGAARKRRSMMRPQIEDAPDPCVRIIAGFAKDGECTYCFCKMNGALLIGGKTGRERTRDHYVPYSRGGRKTVPCCVYCNRLKRDMMPADWWQFRQRNRHFWDAPTPVKAQAARVAPESVPVQYEDAKAQAAFEGAYKNRLHLLRIDAGDSRA